MFRMASLMCVCLAAAGCMPNFRVPTPEGLHGTEAVRLFQAETPTNPDSLRQVIVAHVPPGTPVAQAEQTLEAQGFTCRRYTAWNTLFTTQTVLPPGIYLSGETLDRLRRERANQPLCCMAYRDAVGYWGKGSAQILVLLFPDAAQRVQDVEVHTGSWEGHPYQDSFVKRPGLREPVGLPIATARALLEAAGFRCVSPAGGDKDAAGRSFLLFRACDEFLLGGFLVRVRVYPDEAGIVRETDVLRDFEWFEGEQSMLPGPDDSPGLAVWKGAVYPVRLATRYAAITAFWAVTIPLACFALKYGH
jgi:hypothetical protein